MPSSAAAARDTQELNASVKPAPSEEIEQLVLDAEAELLRMEQLTRDARLHLLAAAQQRIWELIESQVGEMASLEINNRPVKRGYFRSLYGTGGGRVDPGEADGPAELYAEYSRLAGIMFEIVTEQHQGYPDSVMLRRADIGLCKFDENAGPDYRIAYAVEDVPPQRKL